MLRSPIGIFDDATYDEWSVKLSSGDILVFYSDGITEASNREGKFFGAGRLKAVLDFGGVLTSNVFQSFREFSEREGLPPDTVKRTFREDAEALALLRRLERGELSADEFSPQFGATP